MNEKYDFSGWATKVGLLCSDGRVIAKDAFKDCDGKVVPLVWNHQHNEAKNVLGHALLENRGEEGMYTYCSFNDSPEGQHAKLLVEHGDICALSIYANQLKQNGANVVHGMIREVSLVLAGANPGAFIDTVISHSDESSEEAVIYTGIGLELSHAEEASKDEKEDKKEEIEHSEEKAENSGETVKEVFDSLTDKQKNALYAMIGMAVESGETPTDKSEVAHADKDESGETIGDVFNTFSEKQKKAAYILIAAAIEESKNNKSNGGNAKMEHNVFDKETNKNTLVHADMDMIFKDAKACGSLKEACLAHAVTDDDGNTVTYGIANIDYLFPEARSVSNTPDFIKREDGWVRTVMNGCHHSPFSRIKSIHANITMDEARAKGYVKGNQKVEEVFALLKRSTIPQTIYKKQKLDRDDIIDITDFDVVAWIKQEMRMMLDEEIARAILIGDGRSAASDDKIDPTHVRPIWQDASTYTVQKDITVASTASDDTVAKAFIRAAIKSRKEYKGSGNPILFTTEDVLTDCLLIEDSTGRVIYDTEEKLRTALRVSKIVTVPVMENQTRTDTSSVTHTLMGIFVNLADYYIGADKGGNVALFNDFDIDVNQEKYLIETRISGALVKPYSAIVIEKVVTSPSPAVA